MPKNQFHQFVDKYERLVNPAILELFEADLKEDAKKPVQERLANSTGKSEDLRAGDYINMTPLQMAIQKSSWNQSEHLKKIINLLLKYSDFTVEGQEGNALNYAVLYSDCGVDVTKAIVAKNPELLNTKHDSSYPIHVAACHDKTALVVEALLEAKADVNMESSVGLTPLSQASWVNNTAAVIKLLEKGAKTKVYSSSGELPSGPRHYYNQGLPGHDEKEKSETKKHEEIVKIIKEFEVTGKVPSLTMKRG